MTPQEAQMLQDLVQKVQGTQLTEKDPDAEALLEDGLARDPDAIYKLAQTVLIQNIALDQARAQLQQLRQQQTLQPPPARATSFLGGLLHRNAPPAQQAYAQEQQGYQQVPPQYTQAPPQYAAAPPVYGQPGPGAAGGFLRSAATTAAGVAGGMLAFEGVESLIHGFEHGGGYGGGWGGGAGYPGAPGEETVINNYYESPQQDNYGTNGPDEQPQGPFDASSDISGPDEQPQGPYDDNSGGDTGDDQSYVDDSGGGDFSGSGDDYS
ncbi:DUF2076 family protein [Paracidobacterium acidisoli]|nr:DUF2076 family protein [Paracidobacterium acidisoli]MBT9330224.1 DUF2076 domain-containing protein [Paracidobacterium acidisoli]